jgi:hypothetical protein
VRAQPVTAPRIRSVIAAAVAGIMLAATVAAARTPAEAVPSAKPERLGPMLFIGDSVGASIKSELTAALDAGNYAYRFDAKSGRCTKRWPGGCRRGDAVGVIEDLPSSFEPTFAVVELGYNDVPKRLGDSIDTVMRMLLDRGVKKVFWINLSERHPTAGGKNAFDRSNDIISAAGDRWGSKLTILDWNKASSGSSRTSWFIKGSASKPDYIHLTSSGQRQFAGWIRDELDRLRAAGALPGSSSSDADGGDTGDNPSTLPAEDRPELKRGSEGALVVELQKALNKRGAKIWTDGDFGPGTERAVKAFQRKAGLVPDGRVGPRTWKALGF